MKSYAQEPLCFKIYEEEKARLDKKFKQTKTVGQSLQIQNQQFIFFPGHEVSVPVKSWVSDFLGAMNSQSLWSDLDQEEEKVLKGFRNAIKDECSLKKKEYSVLIIMLKESMNDGTFCPDGKMIDRPLLNPWKKFHEALIKKIESGAFQEYCVDKNLTIDQSQRENSSKEVKQEVIIQKPKVEEY
jgi:hypothetical protein